LAITAASGMMANADEFGTTTEENPLYAYVTSVCQDRPSAVSPQPKLRLTGLRVLT
jgi:hypothetical protein